MCPLPARALFHFSWKQQSDCWGHAATRFFHEKINFCTFWSFLKLFKNFRVNSHFYFFDFRDFSWKKCARASETKAFFGIRGHGKNVPTSTWGVRRFTFWLRNLHDNRRGGVDFLHIFSWKIKKIKKIKVRLYCEIFEKLQKTSKNYKSCFFMKKPCRRMSWVVRLLFSQKMKKCSHG